MNIVGDVLQKLTPRYPNKLEGLVGIEDNYEQIESSLKIGSNEVRTLGILGIGGIGKTALATAFFAKLSHEFEGGCFIANVREKSDKHGLEALQSIKQCGVFPVCASAWGLNLFGSSSKEVFELESLAQISDTDTESRPKAIGVGGSDNENENEWEHLHTSSQ
ncbi:hypothetical protein JHK85_044081 [Glycine max]|nr:hypothetical protein JHK85_044081 [Glycine max]